MGESGSILSCAVTVVRGGNGRHMSNRLGLVLLLFVMLAVGCAVTAVSLRSTIDASAQVAMNHVTAPDPLADVLEVREQAGAGGRTWAVVGFTLTILLVVGILAGWLVLKPRMDKQKRLLLNSMRRGNQPDRRPFPRVLPHGSVNDLTALPRVSAVQSVPEVDEGYWNE